MSAPDNRTRIAVATVLFAVCAAAGITLFVYFTQPSMPGPGECVFDPVMPADKAQQQGTPLRYHALVIGISDYDAQSGRGWERLNTARGDAEAVADTLKNAYGFDVKRLLDKEATRSGIIASLDSLSALGASDAALVYFAGHGFYDKEMHEGYWIPCDARKTAGERHAKEDWLWNSMITKIISASSARHVLVIADSCYAGSLFRGEKSSYSRGDRLWYERAIARPSRYLIASGDLEPVLDSGGKHSIFAQELLDYMAYPERDIFAASDLAIALRENVADVAGQMVQMGPLAMAGSSGGEFVFVRSGSSFNWAPAGAIGQVAMASTEQARGDSGKTQALQDALTLAKQGAGGAAERLASTVARANPDDLLVRAVVAHLAQQHRTEARNELKLLLETMEKHKSSRKTDRDREKSARPRIVACLGPTAPATDLAAEPQALLYRVCLRAELQRVGRVQIVEREALEDILREMQLAATDLADPRAQVMTGKILPAAMLLLGDIFTTDQGIRLSLRLVDTETTRVLALFPAQYPKDADVAAVCARLAAEITAKAIELRPLSAESTDVEGTRIEAGIGRFHGAAKDMTFVLIPESAKAGGDEKPLGKARIETLGDLSSVFVAEWDASVAGKPPRTVQVREAGE